MTCHEHRLSDWDPGAWVFVTWNLHGGLPRYKLPDRMGEDSGRVFSQWDRELDLLPESPRWLTNAAVADAVKCAILSGALQWNYYDLRAWVVMPNHVHVLIHPKAGLFRCSCAVKTASGREANRLLGRAGEPFWQLESYEHWVRNPAERERIGRYIEKNPVRAGLVTTPEDWPWSSAHEH